jgi:hypothetical protein
VDLRRLKPIDWLTGLFGAALIGCLWLPWYKALDPRLARALEQHPGGVFTFARAGSPPSTNVDFNAWQAMAVGDVILVIAGLAGVWLVVATAAYSTGAVPIAAAVFATFAGLLAFLLAVIRLVFPPDLGPGPTSRAVGVWLGTAAALGVVLSAVRSMRDERRGAPGTASVPVTELPAPRVSGEVRDA